MSRALGRGLPLGDIARLAYETFREIMAAATDETDARPGMVAVEPRHS